jgi:hypothetical protein
MLKLIVFCHDIYICLRIKKKYSYSRVSLEKLTITKLIETFTTILLDLLAHENLHYILFRGR